jgi:hypothetical protein
VHTLQNKTLRWKGHFEQRKAVMDMGLMDLSEAVRQWLAAPT